MAHTRSMLRMLPLLAATAWLATTAQAAEVTAQTPAPAAASQEQAAARLTAMTRYLASLPAYEVTCKGGFDVVQASGQKIEFLEARSMAVQRPDRLRIAHRGSDGDRNLLVFDGRNITLYNEQAHVYAQAPQPGSLDDAIVYFVRDLKMRLPLARLFTHRSADELAKRLQSVAYVEHTDVLNVPADHITGRVENVDVQLWIAAGDRPLPLRVVLTYFDEPGQPQYRADFIDWKTDSPPPATAFQFTPPPDARRIVFAAQLPPAPTDAAKQSAKEATP